MRCQNRKLFKEHIRKINMVDVETDAEKNLRFDVFSVESEDINYAVRNSTAENIPNINDSKPVFTKVVNALGRAAESMNSLDEAHTKIVNKFKDDFVGKEGSVNSNAARMHIAMLELVEATKGDVDKARKHDLDTEGTLVGNTVPAIPLSRLAASIGRKIMFSRGLRYQSNKASKKDAAEVEELYYVEGLIALELLNDLGYADFHDNMTTIKDYKIAGKRGEEYTKAELVTDARSVVLNTSKLGIKDTTDAGVEAQETAHFTDRSSSNLDGTALGVVVELLGAVRNITQPSNDIAPHTGDISDSLPLKRNDPHGNVQSPSTESARQKLYDASLFVNKGVHKFASALQRLTKGVTKPSASKYLTENNSHSPVLLNSAYGIQTTDDHSIDLNESRAGQNRSKTTPIDDLVDSYSILVDSDGNPAGLHMELKGGRNQRLYYDNTILNAHASKASRHTLTSGDQTVELNTKDFNRVVYAVKDNLGDSSIEFDHITKGGNTDLDEALEIYENYLSATNDNSTVMLVSNMAEIFSGIDYAQLLTTLGGVRDIRKAVSDGSTHVTTEFMVSTDATAQGGNLTLQQSLGTEQTEQLTEYFTRIGLFTDVGKRISDEENTGGDLSSLDDIYGLMTEGTSKFLGKNSGMHTVSVDRVKGQPRANVKLLLQDTLDLLFGSDPKGERELAKNSTLPFIYNQGAKGAIDSMSKSVAKVVMDNLDSADTRDYLAKLLGDPSYSTTKKGKDFLGNTRYVKTPQELFSEKGIYKKVQMAIKSSGVPAQLFSILKTEVNDKYLTEYKEDSKSVFKLAKTVPNSHRMKVLPLGAVLDGETDIKKFGMTLTKVIEVSNDIDLGDGEKHTVLTRKQELNKAIMDVSVTHGMDSGLLYKAIDMVMDDDWTGGGGVVVHDQLIGSVEFVRKVEAVYVDLNARLVAEYDVHSQVMDSIAFYAPEVAATQKFQKLDAKLKARLEAKKAIVRSDLIDLETDALIGDNAKIADFAKDQITNEPTVVAPKTSKEKSKSESAEGTMADKLRKAKADAEAKKNKSSKNSKFTNVENSISAIDVSDVSDDSKAKIEENTQVWVSLLADVMVGMKTKSDVDKFIKKHLKDSSTTFLNGKSSKYLTNASFTLFGLMSVLSKQSTHGMNESQLFALRSERNIAEMFYEVFNNARKSNRAERKKNESNNSLNAGTTSDTKLGITEGNDQTALLESFADESPIIARFLKMSDKPAISGEDNAFIPADNQVVISGTDQGRGGLVPKKLGSADRELQKELIEHEIVHHNTVGYIGKVAAGNDKAAQNDLVYFNKTINVLRRIVGSNKSNFSAEALDRVDYIISRDADAVSIAEFISIMGSEPDTANEIYKAVAGKIPTKTLKARIADFVKKVAASLMALSDKDLMEAVDADKLQAALVRTMENGRSFKEEQRSEAIRYEKGFMALYAGAENKATMRYLNSAVASILNSHVERNGKIVLGKLHNIISDNFPMYVKAVGSLSQYYDDSRGLQALVHTITGEGTNKTAKADLLAQSAKVDSDQKSSIGYQQGEFKKALVGVSADARKTIGRFVKQMPLHNYFTGPQGLEQFNTAAKINAEVTRLEAEIKGVSPRGISDVDNLVDRNVKRTVDTKAGELEGGNIYSLSQYSDDAYGTNVKNLLVLKSIQAIGTKEFEELLANTQLVNLIKDNVVANKLSLVKVGGTESMTDSLIPDIWKETNVMVPVTISSVNSYVNGENNGWKLLRSPTKTELGIAYRQLVDSTDLKGAQTDIKLKTDDVDVVSDYHKKYTNVVQAGNDTFKLVLTPKEKQSMGVEEDFVESLIRGTAHSMAVSDSQSIRDAIVASENRFDGTEDSKLATLDTYLKASNVDAPWFVKLGKDKSYDSLSTATKAKYQLIGRRASDVVGKSGNKFSDEVHLVRKDMAHILIGQHAKSPMNYKPMKWAIRIVKDLTAATKIGMVVVNPAKIASDNLSNLSYLSVAGASPLFIAKNYKEVSRDYHDYQNLLHQTIQLKVKLASDPDNESLKAKLKSIQGQIDTNPVGDLEQKGFINSLGSDLVARSSDVSSGLQADMETALTYMLKNDKGNKNVLGHFINQLHKIGFQSEDYIKYLGGIVGKAKDGQAVEQQLDLSVQRIKDIKSEDDIVAYVSQYTNSPGSELVRLGSSLTDLTDVLAKETLYRHAMQNEGMSAEAARIHVLDSFPDYKENLPMGVKQLSDVGVIMFPSFWLRIQKAIYRLAKDKPVGLSAELMVEAYVTGNVNTIIDANIINKSESFGGLFHLPLASTGLNSVVPENVFNY